MSILLWLTQSDLVKWSWFCMIRLLFNQIIVHIFSQISKLDTINHLMPTPTRIMISKKQSIWNHKTWKKYFCNIKCRNYKFCHKRPQIKPPNNNDRCCVPLWKGRRRNVDWNVDIAKRNRCLNSNSNSYLKKGYSNNKRVEKKRQKLGDENQLKP